MGRRESKSHHGRPSVRHASVGGSRRPSAFSTSSGPQKSMVSTLRDSILKGGSKKKTDEAQRPVEDDLGPMPMNATRKKAIPLIVGVLVVWSSFIYAYSGYAADVESDNRHGPSILDVIKANDRAKFHIGVCGTTIPMLLNAMTLLSTARAEDLAEVAKRRKSRAMSIAHPAGRSSVNGRRVSQAVRPPAHRSSAHGNKSDSSGGGHHSSSRKSHHHKHKKEKKSKHHKHRKSSRQNSSDDTVDSSSSSSSSS